MAFQTTKSFFQVPKIDLKAYFSNGSRQSNLKNTAESAFKGTKINNSKSRAKFFKGVRRQDGDPDFVKNNLGEWPVIALDFKSVIFDQPSSITSQEIIEEITKKVIIPVFDEYDYLLLIQMSQHACRVKYGGESKKTVKDLYSDYNLGEFSTTREKIDFLWREYYDRPPKERLSDNILEFHRYY
jgi:hypothetical protein